VTTFPHARIVRNLLKETATRTRKAEEGVPRCRSEDGVVRLRGGDVQHPNMNGFDLLRSIRADQSCASARLLLVTAEAKKEDIISAARPGERLHRQTLHQGHA